MTAPLRVLIADDQALVRSGLALIIEAQPDMEVAGEAEDGREALAQCRQLAPDVALLDVRMPGLDGLEAARRLVRDQPATRVVMLTTFDLDSYLYEALKIGVSGFFLKDDRPEQLTAGIRAVVTGAALLAPSLTHRVVESYVRAPPRGSAGEPLRRAGLVGGTLAAAAVTAFLWWQNGEYRPIQPGERSTLTGTLRTIRDIPTGRPALTEERRQQLSGAPFEREQRSCAERKSPAQGDDAPSQPQGRAEPGAGSPAGGDGDPRQRDRASSATGRGDDRTAGAGGPDGHAYANSHADADAHPEPSADSVAGRRRSSPCISSARRAPPSWPRRRSRAGGRGSPPGSCASPAR